LNDDESRCKCSWNAGLFVSNYIFDWWSPWCPGAILAFKELLSWRPPYLSPRKLEEKITWRSEIQRHEPRPPKRKRGRFYFLCYNPSRRCYSNEAHMESKYKEKTSMMGGHARVLVERNWGMGSLSASSKDLTTVLMRHFLRIFFGILHSFA